MKISGALEKLIVVILAAALLTGSIRQPLTIAEQAEVYARSVEFDYVGWILSALGEKAGESGLAVPLHLAPENQAQIVVKYFSLVNQINQIESQIQQIYSDPSVKDAGAASTALLETQRKLQNQVDALAPIVESVLQDQVAQALAENGLATGGSILPPVLYRTTPLPKALIISPRDRISQEANISLLANLPLDRITAIEQTIEKNLNVSALVVDIGGVGVYPTMVMQSDDLHWVTDTIAHEWTHNYLTLHPLGLNYDRNAELRTMNETAASIVGNEISTRVLQQYYPGWSSKPSEGTVLASTRMLPQTPFDFRAEMHLTRVTVDGLLAEGKIVEAEQYMEARRQVFVAHGYALRRLNQAYFAFYGAYADVPGGAAGEDPVGPAVRQLRDQAGSLAKFLQEIARMTSFSELQTAVQSSTQTRP